MMGSPSPPHYILQLYMISVIEYNGFCRLIFYLANAAVLSLSLETTGLCSCSFAHFQFYHMQKTVFILFFHFFCTPNLLQGTLANISERTTDEGHPCLFLLFPVKRLLFFSMRYVKSWRLIKV